MSENMVNFNRQVYTAVTEIVDQQVQAFNEASNGALTLAPSTVNMGDFSMEARFRRVPNMVRRRDAANGTKPVSPS